VTLGYGLRLRAPIRRSRSPPGQPGQAPSGQAQAQSNRDFKFLTRRVLQQLRPGNPRPAAPGTPIPVRGRIGKRGFPVSRPFPDSGESGNGDSGNEDSPFPEKLGNGGIGNPGGFLSDEHQLQWTRNILSREYHASALTCSMRVLFRVRGGSQRAWIGNCQKAQATLQHTPPPALAAPPSAPGHRPTEHSTLLSGHWQPSASQPPDLGTVSAIGEVNRSRCHGC
jgi:hypothetical protein